MSQAFRKYPFYERGTNIKDLRPKKQTEVSKHTLAVTRLDKKCQTFRAITPKPLAGISFRKLFLHMQLASFQEMPIACVCHVKHKFESQKANGSLPAIFSDTFPFNFRTARQGTIPKSRTHSPQFYLFRKKLICKSETNFFFFFSQASQS